jgi:hypothetical protein
MTMIAAQLSTASTRERAVVRMRWEQLLFMHWPVSVEAVRGMKPRIPEGLEIDTSDGTAWVGLIPFSMHLRMLGWAAIPTMRRFHECNVRTYVKCHGEPGVWFFSLDAASLLATWGARRFWRLPYHHARMSSRRGGSDIHYASERRSRTPASLRCSWRVGGSLIRPQPGDLAYFLTERYALYSADDRGGLFRGRIDHEPWPLRSAALLRLEESLLRACGLARDASVAPLLHHADAIDVTAFALERLDSVR